MVINNLVVRRKFKSKFFGGEKNVSRENSHPLFYPISDLTFNSCHHRRALWLMIEAITPDNDQQPKPIGYDCDSWQSFEQGECIRDCNADPFNCVRLDPLNDGRNQSIEKNLLLNSITTGRRYFMVTGNEEKFFRNYSF